MVGATNKCNLGVLWHSLTTWFTKIICKVRWRHVAQRWQEKSTNYQCMEAEATNKCKRVHTPCIQKLQYLQVTTRVAVVQLWDTGRLKIPRLQLIITTEKSRNHRDFFKNKFLWILFTISITITGCFTAVPLPQKFYILRLPASRTDSDKIHLVNMSPI